ncbi:MAG: trypsin-like peptidase domain-containing protein, partial [Nitrospirales bacterium]
GGLWTLTTGVISAEFENFRNVKGKHVFQTETGLNRGNSGGPLLDMKGEVVAINTAIARLASDGMPITAISFAVKADVARDWLDGVGVTGNRALHSPDRAPDQTGKPAGPPQETPPPPSGVTADEGRRAPAGAGGAETSPTSGPQIHTPVRPYDMDQLMSERQAAQREMEDLLKDMRDSMRRKSSR